MLSRREFVGRAGAFALSARATAQTTGAHASVAEIEHPHILAEAATDSASVPALVAAYVLTGQDVYAARAQEALQGSMPSIDRISTADGIVNCLPLAEVARATSFLGGVPQPVLTQFSTALHALNSLHAAALERDGRNHNASTWLLLSSALARATRDEKQLDTNRLRFKKITLRAQVDPSGHFPQEVATENPLRNTLFNFDLLCGCAQLLSTPFEDLWNYELIDGIGMRSVAAYLYPMLADRNKWPYPADAAHFRDLPLRRPGLLLSGRAYNRAEYVDLYRTLPSTPPPADIAYSFPIRQPILWTSKAPHGL